MTRTKLLGNVIAVSAVLLGLLAIAAWNPEFRAFLKDFSTMVLAIAAAYLTYCFQRRQAFLISLRELWAKTIEAKADLIDYTYDQMPDQPKYGQAHRSLSIAIDMMRAVYRNLHEDGAKIGRYSFEPLHDMRRALEHLGFTNIPPNGQKAAREKILHAWNAFRWSFLQEFSAPAPSHYVIDPEARDPRRAKG